MKTNKLASLASVLALVSFGAGCAPQSASPANPMAPPAQPTAPAPEAPTPVQPNPSSALLPASTTTRVITLKPVGDSKASGTATFVKTAEGLRVTISLKGTALGDVHSANLESGTCAQRGSVMYPLKDLIKGSSVSILADLGFLNIFNKDKVMSIKIKPSNASPYIACGDIK